MQYQEEKLWRDWWIVALFVALCFDVGCAADADDVTASELPEPRIETLSRDSDSDVRVLPEEEATTLDGPLGTARQALTGLYYVPAGLGVCTNGDDRYPGHPTKNCGVAYLADRAPVRIKKTSCSTQHGNTADLALTDALNRVFAETDGAAYFVWVSSGQDITFRLNCYAGGHAALFTFSSGDGTGQRCFPSSGPNGVFNAPKCAHHNGTTVDIDTASMWSWYSAAVNQYPNACAPSFRHTVYATIVHEIGHYLGLGHEGPVAEASVMGGNSTYQIFPVSDSNCPGGTALAQGDGSGTDRAYEPYSAPTLGANSVEMIRAYMSIGEVGLYPYGQLPE